MRSLVLVLLACACGDPSPSKMDAAGTTDTNGTVDMPAGAPTCATYCTRILAACTATNVQYQTMANCMDSCSHWVPGFAPATTGDTLACRAYHADAAVGDPNTHCLHAGPTGGGQCGQPCNGFCDIAEAVCPTQYPTGTCAAACANFSMTVVYNSTVQSGNQFACRMYHATAASSAPGTHCPHIQPPSAAPCM